MLGFRDDVEVATKESKKHRSVLLDLRDTVKSKVSLREFRESLVAQDVLSKMDQQSGSISIKLALYEKTSRSKSGKKVISFLVVFSPLPNR